MQILTVYVGQGELVVIKHRGEAVVVDSRWPEDRSEKIERLVRAFLKNQQVVGLVLTGFDDDHADPHGVDYILGNFKPNWIMYPKYYKDSGNAADVFRVLRKYERQRKTSGRPLQLISVRLDLYRSQMNNLCQSFTFELFSPHSEDMDNSNNCSIVLKLTGVGGNGFSYLITGDTENERWETITTLFRKRLASDVLSAPHHGSKNAANPKMVALVAPDTVLISAGVGNQYGHPDARAVNLYRRVANHVYRTNIERGVSWLTMRQENRFTSRRIP